MIVFILRMKNLFIINIFNNSQNILIQIVSLFNNIYNKIMNIILFQK